MCPLVVLGWNDVGVRVEKDGGERRIGAGPFEEDERLARDELESLRLEGEGSGLGEDEICCFAVQGLRLRRVDLKVALEP